MSSDITKSVQKFCKDNNLTVLGDLQPVKTPGERLSYRLKVQDNTTNAVKYLAIKVAGKGGIE
jgi:hypothetical protein